MAPTSLFAVTVAVRDLFAAALASEGVPVFLGPPQTDDPLPRCVIVGWDGASEEGRVGSVGQQYHETSTVPRRDDNGTVTGCMWAQSGDAPFTDLLTRVETMLAACQTALRATPQLGLDELLWCELSGVDLFMGDADSNVVRLVFRLSFASLV